MGSSHIDSRASLAGIKGANKNLASLTSLSKDLASIMYDLHTMDGSELPLQVKGKYVPLPQPDLNCMLKKVGPGCFTWNTFALEESAENYDKIFSRKIRAFSKKMEDNRGVFPGSSVFFDADGGFCDMSGVTAVEGDINRLKEELTAHISVFKKEHNRKESYKKLTRVSAEGASADEGSTSSHRDYCYLAEIRSSRCDESESEELSSLGAWIEHLRDRSLIDSLYRERLSNRRAWRESGLAISNANSIQEALELDILWAYAKHVDLREVTGEARRALIKNIRAEETLARLNKDERAIIHSLIQADIEAGRRVFVPLRSLTRKGKIQSLAVRFGSASIALMASFAQACMAAYAMAQIAGFSGAELGIFLQANPAALVAVLLMFLVMLAVSFPSTDRLMTYCLKTAAKNRLLKRPDGSHYSKKQTIALSVSLATSAAIAFGIAVMGFNGSQAAFSAILSVSANAPSVLVIATVISLVYFVTTMSFSAWFSKLAINHWGEWRTKFEQMFMEGRKKGVKMALLAVGSVLGVGLIIGAVTAACISLQTWISTLQGHMRALSHTQTDKLIAAASVVYYFISRFQSNRSMLAIISQKWEGLRTFFKQRTKCEIAAISMLGLPVRIIAEGVFFAATLLFLSARLCLEGLKVFANLLLAIVSPIASIGIAIASKVRGESFRENFHRYLLLPQMTSEFLQRSVPGWRHVYLYCLKRSGPLSIFYNTSAMTMLGADAAADKGSEGQEEESKTHQVKVRNLGLKGYLGNFFLSKNVTDNHAAPVRAHEQSSAHSLFGAVA